VVRGLPSLLLINVSVAVVLYTITWAVTRKLPSLAKAGVALVLLVLLAFAEGLYWAMSNIDEFYPRPTTPLLIPTYLIYAALCLLWFAVIASKRFSGVRRASCLVACALAVVAGIAGVQWPTQARMSQDCRANLRHQWFALYWYADDHDGRLPASPGTKWARLTAPYYTYRPDLLRCPADNGKCATSFSLTPQAAGKPLAKLAEETVLLVENKPRHHGKTHALLAGRIVVDLKPGSVSNAH